MNPFEVLGLDPTMDQDERELERTYLRLSRENHPDLQQDRDPAKMTAVLSRSAAINDAYRILRDPWERARSLIQRARHDALERTKELCPIFLMEMLEQAETITHASGAERETLRAQLQARVEESLAKIREEIAAGHWEEAAVLLHQSRYHRKALADLEARDAGEDRT